MTFRGRQLNTEPLFVSLASLKQKMSNIRSPEFLKPIAGEHLFQRDRDEPMTFPAENVEQMRREDIFREAPRDRSLTGLVEEQVRTGKEKKSYEKTFAEQFPEKYEQLGAKDIEGQRGLQEAVSKGIITEEEASMFTSTEVFPQIGAMGIIKGMTKSLAQQILKVSKKATEKQIDVAFKKALHQPEVKKILRGLTKESGAKEMDLLTGARDILLKGVPKVKETVKLLEKPFTGLPDLTLKTVEKLKGKTIVSKQYIQDLSNMPELKQAERNLLRETLDDMPVSNVNVKEFADKIKLKLLPLKIQYSNKWESISLPSETRGNIAEYDVHIYQSPIKTSAGQIHFTDIQATNKNYFAHTRVEDLGKPFSKPGLQPEIIKKRYVEEETRRIIELQSDLFQKGGLEREKNWMDIANSTEVNKILRKDFSKKYWEQNSKLTSVQGIKDYMIKEYPQKWQDLINKHRPELSKLEPYRNIWHERIIREEIKKAAQDGKTKLQFPTGETAMKVEGLGEVEYRWLFNVGKGQYGQVVGDNLKQNNLKIGLEISDRYSNWIITDILGEGKFKAVPKERYTKLKELPYSKTKLEKELELYTEQFDISGKVDTSNPIFKFYEKEVQKYLKRIKPEMKQIIDPQGVSWFELNITAKDKISPIEAFSGLIGGGLLKEKSRLEK